MKHDPEDLIRSLNSIAFEEWYGRYQDGEFVIFDSDGEGVASGKDALGAWQNFKLNLNTASATESWKGTDTDEFLDEMRRDV